MEAKVAAQEN